MLRFSRVRDAQGPLRLLSRRVARAIAFVSLLPLAGCPEATPPVTMSDAGPGPACAEPSGPGVMHTATITADETWRAAEGPHYVPTSIYVRATLTIEPCVRVLLAEGASINVGDSTTPGTIIARGTSTEPIRFESDTPGTFFGTVSVTRGSLDFEHVTLDHGGAARGAVLEMQGPDDDSVERSLRVVSTTLRSASASGIRLSRGAAFTDDSTGLTIVGAGADPSAAAGTGFPIDIDPPGLSTIPDGSYTGNLHDEIMVRTPHPRVSVDETFRSVGVPYVIDETFLMYDVGGADLTLTIEAGVTLRFDTSTDGSVGMVLGNAAAGSQVTLVARGTAAAPITFTSVASGAAPGAWAGVMIAHGSATGNALTNAVIEYAGGETSTRGFGCGTPENVGGLLIIDWLPSDAFVQASTFRHIRGAGIVSGWRLTAGQTPVNLAAGNTFEDIQDYAMEGHCDVGEWYPDAPDCRIPRTMGVTCVGG